jgi:hypothetical protein
VSPLDLYVDVSARTQGVTDVQRGRTYESDQINAGTDSVTLTNTDGALDPTSTATPLAGRMQPFQPYRIRAMWPPSPNLLSRAIASGGTWGGASVGVITASAALDLLSDTDTTGGSVAASASAWIGTTVTAFSVPSGSVAGQRIAHSAQTAVIPGQPYTLQYRVRNVTASTSLQVKPHLGWVTAGSTSPSAYTYGATVTLTGATAAAWTVLTVTGTAPAGALGMDIGVTVAATAAATCTVHTDGGQLEHGTVASAWVMPGQWYPVSAMFTEDWPSQWTMSGTYGTIAPPASDALSLLPQLTLSDPLTMEIGTHNPRFAYRLDDPAGATSVTDSTGNQIAAPVANSKYGAGGLAFGTAVTAANPTTGVYTGSTGTVATFTNPSPGAGTNSPSTFVSLNRAGIKGPVGTAFTRMIAFRYTAALPAVAACMWSAIDSQHGVTPSSMVLAYIDSFGFPNALIQQFASGTGIGLTGSVSVADSNWHLLMFGYDSVTGFPFLSLDGSYQGGSSGVFMPQGIVSDSIGGFIDGTNGGAAKWNFQGDLSFVAEFPTMFTAADCTNLYTAWKAACAGESTGARYGRILRYAGYQGTTSIQTGLTTSMGPAVTDGQDVGAALEDVVTTEGGTHFIASDGTPTFRSRGYRYNATVPSVIFGERADLGEWPYEDVQLVWDSTHLANKITVTQASTGQNFYAKDTASIAAYCSRNLSRTVNASSALEVQDAANYLKSRYKNPLSRVTSLVLHPAANPAMWAMCLGLELGTRARVMRRAPGLPTAQFEVFIENIDWSMDDKADTVLKLQCSPADTTLYGGFAAWHTTLKTAVTVGATTITVNASQDTVNPLAVQLPSGQSLVLGQGTANAETVTVSSVGATSPGWTSAVITLSAATTKTHAVGDTVCGQLPAGVTDPTTWDTAATFDATTFAY